MDASLFRYTLQIILTVVVTGELEIVSQSCCNLGSSWANSNGVCDAYPKPIPGVPVDFQFVCYSALEACCIRAHRSKNCDKGKQSAYIGKECTVLQDIAGESHKDCCDGCKFGFYTAESHEACKVPLQTFGAFWEEAFLSCCLHREQLIQNETKTTTSVEDTLTEAITSIPNITTPSVILETTSKPEISSHCGNSNFCSQVCTDTEQGIQCSCYPGYSLATDQRTCDDIDECSLGISNCISGSDVCHNTIGGFQCLPDRNMNIPVVPSPSYCPTGFVWSSPSRGCYDVDECALGTHTCGSKNQCTNTIGSFICQRSFSQVCPTGFKYDDSSVSCIDIDECSEELHSCQLEQLCSNTLGSYECIIRRHPKCPPGYKFSPANLGIPDTCIDVDECNENIDTCDKEREDCINDIGTYICILKAVPTESCPSGYEYNEREARCTDIDECVIGQHACNPPFQICYNTAGGYRCILACPPGFVPDQENLNECRDLDECAEHFDDCNHQYETCINTNGSYTCHSLNSGHVARMQCPQGYKMNLKTRVCEDIDECTDGTHSCFHNSQTCVNTPGSHQCMLLHTEQCNSGFYYKSTSRICDDINECATGQNNCTQTEICINTNGSYHCQRKPLCSSGFTLDPDGKSCVDMNECLEPNVCNANTHCINTFGSYLCRENVRCRIGYKQDSSNRCADIDECTARTNDCGPTQVCKNTQGSYTCHCPSGYAMLSLRHCEDIDECQRGQICSSNSQCRNTLGSYECHCKAGFKRESNRSSCIDVDECIDKSNVCHHRCVNTWGSYKCICEQGYTLNSDRQTCKDFDECTELKHGKLCFGQCVNTPGSYSCSCPQGYSLSRDNRSCEDINECQNAYACNENDVCINTHGGYNCTTVSCPTNYIEQEGQASSNNKAPTISCKKHCHPDDVSCLTNTTQTIVYQFISLPTIHRLRSPLILTTMRAIVRKRKYHFDSEHNILEGNNQGYFDILRGNGVGSLRLVWPVSGPQEFRIKIQMSIRPRYSRQVSPPTLHHVAFIYVLVSSYDY